MVNNALRTNLKAARDTQYKFIELIELLFIDGSPAGVKAMLSAMDLCHNNVRLPLVPVNRSIQTRIQKAMDDLKSSNSKF